MPSTPPAAPASSPTVEQMIREAVRRNGLPEGAVRIRAHVERDAWTFSYPGYSAVTITGLELLQSGDPQGFLVARVADMLRLPVV